MRYCVNPQCSRDVSTRANGYAACKPCFRKTGLKRAQYEDLGSFNQRLAIFFGVNTADVIRVKHSRHTRRL